MMTIVAWCTKVILAEGSSRGKFDMLPSEPSANCGSTYRYFAQEIIGNMLGLEPRKWRKPRRADPALNQARKAKLGNKFQPFNWTLQLQSQ